jgi:Putative transmembrane protein (PGPGW)
MAAPSGRKAAKGIAIQVAGWLLVLIGIAALVLPGPGLLALFAGMALLATQYSWAERRLAPVKKAALRTAADSVASGPRIVLSIISVAGLIAVGVVWGLRPPAPGWWPLADRWWLLGGWGTGATLIFSGVIAGAMIVYSYLHFRDIRHDEAPEDRPDSGPTVARPDHPIE